MTYSDSSDTGHGGYIFNFPLLEFSLNGIFKCFKSRLAFREQTTQIFHADLR